MASRRVSHLSDPLGSDIYESWQTTVDEAIRHGLTTRVAYTYSHDISMNTSILIPQYRNYDRYTSALDRPNALVWAATYELPFGRGQTVSSTGRPGAGHRRLDIRRARSLTIPEAHSASLPRRLPAIAPATRKPQIRFYRTRRSWAAAWVASLTSIRWHLRQSLTASFGNAGFDTLRGPGAPISI